MQPAIEIVIVVVFMLIVGYFSSAIKLFRDEYKQFVSQLILYIAIPFAVFYNTFTSFSKEMFISSGLLAFVPFGVMIALLLLSVPLGRLIGVEKGRRGVFACMCGIPNILFVGFPICLGMFGDSSAPYVMINYSANMFIFFGLAITITRRDAGGGTITLKEFGRGLINPPFIAFISCMILLVVGFKPPQVMLKISNYFGALVTPLSMLFIGKCIHQHGLKNLRLDKYQLTIMSVRFILAPLITFYTLRALGCNEFATQVFTVLSAMPSAMQITIVAAQYGADSHFAAVSATTTTIASLLFVPIYMYVMPLLW